jgi:hypothetical protein
MKRQGENLAIKGDYTTIYKQVKGMATTIEQFFNAMPSISKNINKNTKLYLPFATKWQIADLTKPEQKLAVMEQVIQNVQFNPNLQSQNSVVDMGSNFYKLQADWLRRVDYNG